VFSRVRGRPAAECRAPLGRCPAVARGPAGKTEVFAFKVFSAVQRSFPTTVPSSVEQVVVMQAPVVAVFCPSAGESIKSHTMATERVRLGRGPVVRR